MSTIGTRGPGSVSDQIRNELQDRRHANIVTQVIDRARAGLFSPDFKNVGPDADLLRASSTGSLDLAMDLAALYLAVAFRQADLKPELVPACSPGQYAKVRLAAIVLSNPDATKDELFEAWAALQSTDDMGSDEQNKTVQEMHDEAQRRWKAKR